MNKKFFIIIGRSGSGKGTQSLMLKDELAKRDYEDVKHITTGGGFRTLFESDTYTARTAKSIGENGGLAPDFLAIWNWANIFLENLQENTTVILDGAPRRPIEVGALHAALSFYGYKEPVIIYLDVSEVWALEKLTSRGRSDDTTDEDRERKMKWFFDETLPCVAEYKANPLYTFIHLNGEQDREKVSEELLQKISHLV